jgi:antitoxin VapB
MLQIRNERVVRLAAKLAAIRRSTKTEAVLRALENELAHIESEKTLEERVRPIQDRIASRPSTGLEADKAFFDELSGELYRCRRLRYRRDPVARTGVCGADRHPRTGRRPATSPIAIYEAALGLRRKRHCSVPKQRPTTWSFSASPVSRWWRSS